MSEREKAAWKAYQKAAAQAGKEAEG